MPFATSFPAWNQHCTGKLEPGFEACGFHYVSYSGLVTNSMYVHHVTGHARYKHKNSINSAWSADSWAFATGSCARSTRRTWSWRTTGRAARCPETTHSPSPQVRTRQQHGRGWFQMRSSIGHLAIHPLEFVLSADVNRRFGDEVFLFLAPRAFSGDYLHLVLLPTAAISARKLTMEALDEFCNEVRNWSLGQVVLFYYYNYKESWFSCSCNHSIRWNRF